MRFGSLVLVLIYFSQVNITHSGVIKQVIEFSYILVELQTGLAFRPMFLLLYCQTFEIVLQGWLILFEIVVGQSNLRHNICVLAGLHFLLLQYSQHLQQFLLAKLKLFDLLVTLSYRSCKIEVLVLFTLK